MSLLKKSSLVITPNAYKEGKLYSVIPSDGSGDLSVTRATTATRVNSAGLVELVPYNFLTNSNDLTGTWNLFQTTKTSGQADPFGGNNAIKLKYNTSTAYHSIRQGLSGITGSNAHSVYAKAGELQFLQIASAQSVDEYANFNLGTGVIGTYGSLASQVQMQSVGNGWYRCSVVFTNGSNGIYCAIANSDSMGWLGVNAYAGLNDTNGLFLYGAQVNQGSLKDYYPTETRLNIPRLDYSLGSCPSILVEPQRTNLALYSEQFDSATWAKTRITATANATTSPSGIVDADKLIPSVDNNNHIITQISIPVTAQIYTASVYAKKGEYDTVRLLLSNLWASPNPNAIFNLTTKTVFSTQNATTKITELENDWFRLEITATINAISGSNAHLIIYVGDNDNVTFAGDGTSGLYLWGAQLEAGAYATSYIPTTSASVTRNNDVISKTGISSLINSEEGVLFIEMATLSNDGTLRLIQLDDGTDNNRVSMYFDTVANIFYTNIVVNGNPNPLISTSLLVNNFNKYALLWEQNRVEMWINGSKDKEDLIFSTFAPNVLTRLMFSLSNGSTGKFNGNVKTLSLWKEALTDGELSMLTSGIYTPELAYAAIGLTSESPACLESSINAIL